MSQADLVRASIDFLYEEDGPGFFIMSEGGKIDWASHGNDTKTAILETLSLSDAVAEAVAFYNEHPDETLIIVTADHETGGLTLAYDEGYNMYFDKIDRIDPKTVRKIWTRPPMRHASDGPPKTIRLPTCPYSPSVPAADCSPAGWTIQRYRRGYARQ